MPQLGGWEFIVLIAVLLLLFGSKKLPDMARSAGQSVRVLKGELKGLKDDSKSEAPPRSSDAGSPNGRPSDAGSPNGKPSDASGAEAWAPRKPSENKPVDP